MVPLESIQSQNSVFNACNYLPACQVDELDQDVYNVQ